MVEVSIRFRARMGARLAGQLARTGVYVFQSASERGWAPDLHGIRIYRADVSIRFRARMGARLGPGDDNGAGEVSIRFRARMGARPPPLALTSIARFNPLQSADGRQTLGGFEEVMRKGFNPLQSADGRQTRHRLPGAGRPVSIRFRARMGARQFPPAQSGKCPFQSASERGWAPDRHSDEPLTARESFNPLQSADGRQTDMVELVLGLYRFNPLQSADGRQTSRNLYRRSGVRPAGFQSASERGWAPDPSTRISGSTLSFNPLQSADGRQTVGLGVVGAMLRFNPLQSADGRQTGTGFRAGRPFGFNPLQSADGRQTKRGRCWHGSQSFNPLQSADGRQTWVTSFRTREFVSIRFRARMGARLPRYIAAIAKASFNPLQSADGRQANGVNELSAPLVSIRFRARMGARH